MDALIIEKTKLTPSVKLYPTGELFFNGLSLPEDPLSFYAPIIEWVKNCKSESITAEICLQYMNTSSSKVIFSLLCKIKDNPYVKDIKVKWKYEEGDEESYDTGLDFQEMSQLPFFFEECAEIA